MTETSDPRRAALLARLRARTAVPPPANHAHPAPPPSAGAPRPRSRVVDPEDLVGTFARTAAEAGAVVHRLDLDLEDLRHLGGLAADRPASADLVGALEAVGGTLHEGGPVVVSADPDAGALRPWLEGLGRPVLDHEPAASAGAALGVTGCVAAIAATGSVALDAGVAGGRGASLLPPVHLCVVRASAVVESTGDVLGRLGDRADGPPSNLVLVTGPSRTGDIEQILTTGVHGPAAVHLVLLDRA